MAFVIFGQLMLMGPFLYNAGEIIFHVVVLWSSARLKWQEHQHQPNQEEDNMSIWEMKRVSGPVSFRTIWEIVQLLCCLFPFDWLNLVFVSVQRPTSYLQLLIWDICPFGNNITTNRLYHKWSWPELWNAFLVYFLCHGRVVLLLVNFLK